MVNTDSLTLPSTLLLSRVGSTKKVMMDKNSKSQSPIDTLGIRGLKTPKPFKLSNLHFEEEGYFKGNKYFKLEKNSVWYCPELGDPVPYTLSTDNTLSGVLLVCFILAMFSFSVSRSFIISQIQTFFGASRSMQVKAESISEGRIMPLLLLQTSLLLGVIFFIIWGHISGAVCNNDAQLVKIAIFFAEFVGYFTIKRFFYSVVNWTFFENEQSRNWTKARLFLNTIEGILLFPLVLLLVYFNLSFHIAIIYSAFVVFFVKILQLYKSYIIFFSRRTISLQIILYFCTLEIIPLILLWGVLTLTGNYLNINF